MEKFLDFAISLAKDCGKIISKSFRKTHSIKYKGPVDIVTEVDIASQHLATSRIKKAFPHHSILAEEENTLISNGTKFKWIIDPLDGTTNYAHGVPIFCFSVALEVDSEIVLGCAYNPVLKELFYAYEGHGAYFNGKQVNVSKSDCFEKSLLSTGFPYDKKTNPDNNFDHFRDISISVRGIRRLGSAVLDLCYTAAGFLDGYWELNLNPWDMASGSLMVKEAGGAVSDFCKKPLNIYNRRILASNGLIHDELSKILCV
ncbi:MAG: inositol monophosphatase [Deltaproteobacteria bacterium]|nr:inositol monophosphatase [Deltaproteobacteria bacterium]